jgi:hypothetical protein
LLQPIGSASAFLVWLHFSRDNSTIVRSITIDHSDCW